RKSPGINALWSGSYGAWEKPSLIRRPIGRRFQIVTEQNHQPTCRLFLLITQDSPILRRLALSTLPRLRSFGERLRFGSTTGGDTPAGSLHPDPPNSTAGGSHRCGFLPSLNSCQLLL